MAGALIGALRVSLSAETSAFEAGMKRSQRQAANTAKSIQGSFSGLKGVLGAGLAGFIGALSVGALLRASKAALDYAGSLAEVAQQVGVTARDLQVLRFAGGQVGISTEQMDKALQKFTKSLGDARNGSAEAIKTFKALGFTDQDIKRLDAHEALLKTADGLEKVGDRASRASPEVRLFGKAGQQLDTLLSQGSRGINELADAAEKLGIVLSDEQIRNADRTADKIEALKTVLSANIASAVADNAEGIFTLVNALAQLVSIIPKAIQGWKAFFAVTATAANAMAHLENPVTALQRLGAKQNNASLASRFAADRAAIAMKKAGTGSGLPNFLASGGGGRKAREDHSAEKALREAFQFDQEVRRANIDILNAKKDLAADYTEQTSISIQILDAERAAYVAELQYQVAAKEKTSAQAAQLQAAYDSKDALERKALLDEEEAKRAEEFQTLRQHDFDRQRDLLEARSDIAETASERRKIELELLRIAYEQKKQALQNIIETSKSFQEIEDARRDLENLKKTQPLAQQSVLQNTQGPLEQFFSTVPKTAAEAQEAMERLQVMGIDGAINSIVALTDGFQSFRDTAISAIKQVIAELLRMQLMKLALNLFGSAVGGFNSAGLVSGNLSALSASGGIALGSSGGGLLPRAHGGSVIRGHGYLIGERGPEIFMPKLSGSIIPSSSIAFGNDNKAMRGGDFHFNVNVNGSVTDAEARRTGMQIAAGFQSRMAMASSKGIAGNG